jgi:predicted nucleic acid-binding protein
VAGKGVLVDTGPLVALLSADDQHHQACLDASKNLRGPFLTVWPVITEAAYLLRDRSDAIAKLLERVRIKKLGLLDLTAADVDGISRVLTDYADQQFDLADASLMYLSQREGIERVFTTDRRHFAVFRGEKGKPLTLFPAIL